VEEEFKQICSRELLAEKAAQIQKRISVEKNAAFCRLDFDPTTFYENRFWNQRMGGQLINKNHRTLCILKFTRSSDRNEAAT